MRRSPLIRAVQTIALGSALTTALCGQSFEKGSSQWHQYLTGYFMGAAMDGDVVVRGQPASVDVPFSDIWDNLEMGLMLNYRAEKDRVSFGADLIFMELSSRTPNGLAEVEMDQWMVEGNFGWKLTDVFEVIGGVRYNDLELAVHSDVAEQNSISQSQDWFDPFVGFRVFVPLGSAVGLIGRADVGGFGIGSDLAYQLAAYLRVNISESFSILGGYRYFDMDYEDGDANSRFEYDMTIQGPVLGLDWSF